MIDFDSPWKEALDLYLEDFLLLLFPKIHAAIDWSRGYESLDKELQQIVRESEVGRRIVDKLIRVWRKDGVEQWVLIHIEFQNDDDAHFPKRMFEYHIRLFDKYDRPIASLSVLGDENVNWRPNHFEQELWGCKIRLDFLTTKLLDWNDRWDELAHSGNRMAAVIMAHLKAKATTRDLKARLSWKTTIVRSLYEQSLSRDEIRMLYRLIDWLMELPPELTHRFHEEHSIFERSQNMPYVTSTDRLVREEGRVEGRVEGLHDAIALVAEVRFGSLPPDFLDELNSVQDFNRLKAARDAIRSVSSLDALRAIWRGDD